MTKKRNWSSRTILFMFAIVMTSCKQDVEEIPGGLSPFWYRDVEWMDLSLLNFSNKLEKDKSIDVIMTLDSISNDLIKYNGGIRKDDFLFYGKIHPESASVVKYFKINNRLKRCIVNISYLIERDRRKNSVPYFVLANSFVFNVKNIAVSFGSDEYFRVMPVNSVLSDVVALKMLFYIYCIERE